MKKKIIIVGGGISGLTAGIYGLENGFDVTILEKNPVVGGLCTGWYRKGHYIDGCIHWMAGTVASSDAYKIWKTNDAIKEDTDIICLDNWGTFEYQGAKVIFYKDLDKAEKHWLEISPIDSKEIKHFFKIVRDIKSVKLPLDRPINMMSPLKLIKIGWSVLKVWPSYIKSMKISVKDYANRFQSPALRWALNHAQCEVGNLYCLAFSYGIIAGGDGGIPEGGSLAMAKRMKDKFLSLGGQLKINAPVSDVLKENGKTVGVILENKAQFFSDYVILATDINYAIHDLLKDKYKIKKLNKRYADPVRYPAMSACLLTYEAKNIQTPIHYAFECEEFRCGVSNIIHLIIRNHNYDEKTYVKDGKTLVSVLIDQYGCDYDFWNNLYANNVDEYKRLKELLGEEVRKRVIKQIPEFEDSLILLDVATPKTLNRYTNVSRGAYMSFMFTSQDFAFSHNGVIKGLDNLVLAGQWLQAPGGLPIAAAEGKFAVQRICKLEGKKFCE